MTFSDVMGLLGGLALFLYGMQIMSSGLENVAGNKMKPVLGILAGTVFTTLIQSFSASVGILQALANSGVIGLGSAAFVLFGQNIGTCVTALLASIGTNRNARRTTVIHISFNVVTSLLLIPFGGLLTLLAEKLLPDKGDKKEEGPALHYLLDLSHINADKLGAVAISTEGIRKELQRMLDMARENVIGAFWVFAKKDTEQFKEMCARACLRCCRKTIRMLWTGTQEWPAWNKESTT